MSEIKTVGDLVALVQKKEYELKDALRKKHTVCTMTNREITEDFKQKFRDEVVRLNHEYSELMKKDLKDLL